MAEVRTYKITCNQCGYSELVPEARLIYEEGKTCPRCYKGKMHWVTPAEEARRRKLEEIHGQRKRVMAEERKISPLWIIPVGIILGGGAGFGLLAALSREGPPTPPPGRATLYGKVTDTITGQPISGVLVTLDGMQVYTDVQGNYAFTDLETGTYSLFFQKEGYEEIEMADITLQEGNNELNVQLTPVAKAKFYMPAEMDVKVTDGQILDMYWNCEFSVTITNKGNATGTYTLRGQDNLAPAWDGPRPWDPFQVTLAPGQTYKWSVSYWIDFRRVSAPYVWELWGDWEQDNYSRGEARP